MVKPQKWPPISEGMWRQLEDEASCFSQHLIIPTTASNQQKQSVSQKNPTINPTEPSSEFKSAVNRCQRVFLTRFRCSYNRTLTSLKHKQSSHSASTLLSSVAIVLLAVSTSLVHLSAGSVLPALVEPTQQAAHIQSRAGGLEAGDYVDEAGELEVMANQQQIPTAQLMAAAGHIVPDNFFLPGGSIPALYHHHQQARLAAVAAHHQYQQQQQQQHQQQQQQQQTAADQLQSSSSHVQARHVAPPVGSVQQVGGKYIRQADLIAAAVEQHNQQQQQQQEGAGLIDFNGYNLVGQTAAENAAAAGGSLGPVDLADFLHPSASSQYEQQQQQFAAEQQIAAELQAMAQLQQQHHHHNNHRQQQTLDNSPQSSENSLSESLPGAGEQYTAASLGPAYQIITHPGNQQQQEQLAATYSVNSNYENKQHSNQQKPYGLPTKSSSKEPSDMLKPLGNPKTVSSPVIDFVTQHLPKTSALDQAANKIPQIQTPTVFSFSSSKDPAEKMKVVQQKKRTVMRQAEQFAKMMIKSMNDKFGTTIGDQTDIPFLLSSIGPLGMAQNLLTDPTLLVTLLNSAERIYFSDALPGPAKTAIRPVLNIFRVPNKKRDKANLLNVISFLASGGQTPANTGVKHRQGTGVEKNSKSKST